MLADLSTHSQTIIYYGHEWVILECLAVRDACIIILVYGDVSGDSGVELAQHIV